MKLILFQIYNIYKRYRYITFSYYKYIFLKCWDIWCVENLIPIEFSCTYSKLKIEWIQLHIFQIENWINSVAHFPNWKLNVQLNWIEFPDNHFDLSVTFDSRGLCFAKGWQSHFEKFLPGNALTLRKLNFHFLSHRMWYDRGDSFPFNFEPNGNPLG